MVYVCSEVSNFGSIFMRKTLLMALVAAAVLSGGMFGTPAEAMMLAAPPGQAATGASVILKADAPKATFVCGYFGCVWVKPGYWGYYRGPYRYYGRGWAGHR